MADETSPMTTDARDAVDELRRLYAQAAPGPWVSLPTANKDGYYVAEFSRPGARGIWTDNGVCGQATGKLIAAMHTALPSLLEAADELARLRGESANRCAECRGVGFVHGAGTSQGAMVYCPACRGTGVKRARERRAGK